MWVETHFLPKDSQPTKECANVQLIDQTTNERINHPLKERTYQLANQSTTKIIQLASEQKSERMKERKQSVNQQNKQPSIQSAETTNQPTLNQATNQTTN